MMESTTSPTKRHQPHGTPELDETHLRGIALGFTNLNNYITRSLLHAGGFRQTVQNQISQP